MRSSVVYVGAVHADQLGLLAGREFWLLALEPATGAGYGHALAGAHLQEVGLELKDHRQPDFTVVQRSTDEPVRWCARLRVARMAALPCMAVFLQVAHAHDVGN